MEALSFLAAPIVLTFLLVAIHAYLGLHVLERGVIFVDISLAQVAALGSSLSLFFISSGDENSSLAILASMGLCLFAAFSLSLLRYYEKVISQEVLIGITYAFASGLLILVLDHSPHGAEHLKEAMIGNILFVTWSKVLFTGVVYLVIGIIHFIFRRQFWAASKGETKSLLWDFLFYFLFGIVITFSTHHAGVLVVFSILVIPSALANRFFANARIRSKILFAWITGVVGTIAAFFLSYRFDLPTGAGIVATLASGFFIVLIVKIVAENSKAELN